MKDNQLILFPELDPYKTKIKNIDYEYSILENGYSLNTENNPKKTHAWEYLLGYLNYLKNEEIVQLTIEPNYFGTGSILNPLNKIRVGVFVRCKDEKNMEEFMNYYYNIVGVDYIVIFDHNSNPSITTITSNFNNIPKTKYEVITLDSIGLPNTTNYNTFDGKFDKSILPILKKNMDYCLYVDTDEYLHMAKFKNIKDIIEYYSPFDQLSIQWVLFGNNNLLTNGNGSKLLPAFTKSNNKYNKHSKSLCKLSTVSNNTNPHYFDGPKNIKNIFNKNTKLLPVNNDMSKMVVDNNYIYLAHYMVQDTTSFFTRRYLNNSSVRLKELGIDKETPNYLKDNTNNIIKAIHNDDNDNNGNNTIIDKIKVFFQEHNTNVKDNYDLVSKY